MNAEQIVQNVEAIGGLLFLDGGRIRYELPAAAAPLLNDLQSHRNAVIDILRLRGSAPKMPMGVRLTKWAPKTPPVMLTSWSVVIDTHKFITSTLSELEAALAGYHWLAGGWSVRELVERLEQLGISVEVDEQQVEPSIRRSL